MVKIKVKGYEFELKTVTSGYDRKAVIYVNNIYEALKKLGLESYDVKVPTDILGNKNLPAFAEWYFDGHHLQYRYGGCNRFIDNLYVVSKVIELEVESVVNKTKTVADFIYDFTEEKDVKETRNNAREILGVDPKENNLEVINKKFKELSRELHPDMPNGDLDKFQALNKAHKLLKKELG